MKTTLHNRLNRYGIAFIFCTLWFSTTSFGQQFTFEVNSVRIDTLKICTNSSEDITIVCQPFQVVWDCDSIAYSWSAPSNLGTFSSNTGNNVTFTAASSANTGDITVTVTDTRNSPQNPPLDVTLPVVVFETPSGNILVQETSGAMSDDGIICGGDVVTLTAPDGDNYLWNNSSTTQQITDSPTVTTSYNVIVTNNGICSADFNTTVNVTANPIVDRIINFCDGSTLDSVVVIASISNGTLEYSVNGGGYQNSEVFLPSDVNIGAINTFSIREVTTTCEDSESHLVECIPSCPTVNNNNLTSGNQSICQGQSAMTIQGSVATTNPSVNFEYVWIQSVGGAGYTDISNSNMQNYVPGMLTQTTSFRRIVRIIDCPDDTTSMTVTVTVNPNLTAMINPSTDTICRGDTTLLSAIANGGTGPYTYSWSNSQTGNSIAVSPTTNTSFRVTITDSNMCSDTASSMITIASNPTVMINSSSASICEGNTTLLSAIVNGGTSPYDYNWSTGGIGSSISVSPIATTEYRVTVSDGNECSDDAVYNLMVLSPPTVQINTTTPEICQGQAALLSAVVSGANGGVSYLWSNADTMNSTTVRPNVNTDYSVSIVDAEGCRDTANTSLQVNPKPAVQIMARDTAICRGDSTILTASGTNGTPTYSYIWSNGDTTDFIVVNPTQSRGYTVITEDSKQCMDTASFSLTVNNLPMPSRLPGIEANDACEGQQAISITAYYTSGSSTPLNGNSFSWTSPTNISYTGDQVAILDRDVSESLHEGIWELEVTDSNGCSATNSATISVFRVPTLTGFLFPDKICDGTTFEATPEILPGESTSFIYRWRADNQNYSTPSLSHIWSNSSLDNEFSLLITDQNGCVSSNADDVYVNSNPEVIVDFESMEPDFDKDALRTNIVFDLVSETFGGEAGSTIDSLLWCIDPYLLRAATGDTIRSASTNSINNIFASDSLVGSDVNINLKVTDSNGCFNEFKDDFRFNNKDCRLSKNNFAQSDSTYVFCTGQSIVLDIEYTPSTGGVPPFNLRRLEYLFDDNLIDVVIDPSNLTEPEVIFKSQVSSTNLRVISVENNGSDCQSVINYTFGIANILTAPDSVGQINDTICNTGNVSEDFIWVLQGFNTGGRRAEIVLNYSNNKTDVIEIINDIASIEFSKLDLDRNSDNTITISQIRYVNDNLQDCSITGLNLQYSFYYQECGTSVILDDYDTGDFTSPSPNGSTFPICFGDSFDIERVGLDSDGTNDATTVVYSIFTRVDPIDEVEFNNIGELLRIDNALIIDEKTTINTASAGLLTGTKWFLYTAIEDSRGPVLISQDPIEIVVLPSPSISLSGDAGACLNTRDYIITVNDTTMIGIDSTVRSDVTFDNNGTSITSELITKAPNMESSYLNLNEDRLTPFNDQIIVQAIKTNLYDNFAGIACMDTTEYSINVIGTALENDNAKIRWWPGNILVATIDGVSIDESLNYQWYRNGISLGDNSTGAFISLPESTDFESNGLPKDNNGEPVEYSVDVWEDGNDICPLTLYYNGDGFRPRGDGGLEEVETKLRILPNPNNGLFAVDMNFSLDEIRDLKILDSQGKLVKKLAPEDVEFKKVLNLQELPAGVYVIRGVLTEGKVLNSKFLIF